MDVDLATFYQNVFDALAPGGTFFTSAASRGRGSDTLLRAFEFDVHYRTSADIERILAIAAVEVRGNHARHGWTPDISCAHRSHERHRCSPANGDAPPPKPRPCGIPPQPTPATILSCLGERCAFAAQPHTRENAPHPADGSRGGCCNTGLRPSADTSLCFGLPSCNGRSTICDRRRAPRHAADESRALV